MSEQNRRPKSGEVWRRRKNGEGVRIDWTSPPDWIEQTVRYQRISGTRRAHHTRKAIPAFIKEFEPDV